MKITKENIKETLRSIMQEESEYQVFFRKALEKAGKSITDMSDEEKKEFFNKIDSAWDGKGEKNEELTGNQHKLDIDGDGEIEASDLAALRAGEKKEESVNESKKMFSVHPHSTGSKKFDISVYDGRKNKDGSPFIDVVTANHNLELKDKIQAYKSKGYTEVDNVGKKLGVKYKTESVNEKVSPKDLEAIKGAVESASSFMGVGSELKKLGMKYIFATSPIPIYVVQDKSGNRVGIVNKKYATKPDFVIGDTAIGVMESKVNEAQKINPTSMKFLKGMKKIKVKGLGGYMPGVDYVYVDGDKYYFVDSEGDHMELKNTNTIKQLHKLHGKSLGESVNEEEIKWNAVQNAIINFLKVNTKILDKRVQAKDTDGVKGGLKSIISGLTNAQRSLKLESVNEAKVGDFEMGDFVHFKSANKTGMVKKISGDKVTIMTMKGDFTGDIKDIQVLYQDNVNPSVNEEKYTVIDPRGNSLGTADKTQVAMAAKKKGGEKAGYFVVSAKNALKARRALEKFKGDFKNPKLKDMMANLYYESVNEEIAVGKMVKVVDNPHWEAALGKKGPFKRKVKGIYGDSVFFTDGSNSDMKYVKESVESVITEQLVPVDKKAVDAFFDKKGFEGKNLNSDGKVLKTVGIGSQEMYIHTPKGVKFVGKVTGKYAQSVVQYVNKNHKSDLSETITEGRAFINAARKAKEEGKTEFEFNGKKYPVTIK